MLKNIDSLPEIHHDFSALEVRLLFQYDIFNIGSDFTKIIFRGFLVKENRKWKFKECLIHALF